MSVPRFKQDLKRFSDTLDRRARTFVIAYATTVRRDLALATPFLTGRAASGWNASVGGPNLREFGPAARFPSREAAASAGDESLSDFLLGDTIHVSNSVPYIADLNAGTSAKAPANFVEMTVQEATKGLAGRLIKSVRLG